MTFAVICAICVICVQKKTYWTPSFPIAARQCDDAPTSCDIAVDWLNNAVKSCDNAANQCVNAVWRRIMFIVTNK